MDVLDRAVTASPKGKEDERRWAKRLRAGPSRSGPMGPAAARSTRPVTEPLLGLLQEAGPRAGHELVANNTDGAPWGEFGLLLAFQRAQKKAGLLGSRFHDLRHFFVTSLFRAGAPAPAVQALAGHADISTTSRHAHLVQADLWAAVARLAWRPW